MSDHARHTLVDGGRYPDRLADGGGKIGLIDAHPAVFENVGQIVAGAIHPLDSTGPQSAVIVLNREKKLPHHRVAVIPGQRPFHILDAVGVIDHINQQSGRYILNTEIHQVAVLDIIIEYVHRTR